MLTYRRATGLAAPNNASVTIDQLLQCLDIFVIDKHWAWPFAIDEQRILSFGSRANSRSFPGATLSRWRSTQSRHKTSNLCKPK